MTDTSVTPYDVLSFDRGRLSQRHSSWTVLGAGTVTLGVLVGSWLVDHRAPTGPMPSAGTAQLAAAFHLPRAAPLPDLAPALTPASPPAPAHVAEASRSDGALLDPAFVHGPAPLSLAESAPLGARFVAAAPLPAAEPAPVIAMIVPLPEAQDGAAHDVAHDVAPAPVQSAAAISTPQIETVPLPAPRPAFRWAAPEQYRTARRQVARNTDTAPTPAAPAAAPADNRGFLERFFGALKPSNGPVLAYAAPEDGLFSRSLSPATPHDRYTAVYDIAAHTVYMPDGSKLEAHSGLGGMMDDPRHVTARNTGPTPPHLYDLTLRESLFHGVQALRLNPIGGGGVYGRDGLLAHTYMLGPNGQSNGCVSFRDYQAFLRAYQNGQVKRLVVVAGLG